MTRYQLLTGMERERGKYYISLYFRLPENYSIYRHKNYKSSWNVNLRPSSETLWNNCRNCFNKVFVTSCYAILGHKTSLAGGLKYMYLIGHGAHVRKVTTKMSYNFSTLWDLRVLRKQQKAPKVSFRGGKFIWKFQFFIARGYLQRALQYAWSSISSSKLCLSHKIKRVLFNFRRIRSVGRHIGVHIDLGHRLGQP